jgi:thiazole synthase
MLKIADRSFRSRLFLGTGKFSSAETLKQAIEASGSEMITVALRLQDVGAAAVMPLGAPIGTNLGLITKFQVEIIIEQARVPVIVDAGLGAPSDAAMAMEIGADAVLVNTAISIAGDPVKMAAAFAKAVEAGRAAYEAGLGRKSSEASASSPLNGLDFIKNV